MQTCFWDSVINYLGVPDFEYHRGALEQASPITYVSKNFPPSFFMVSFDDASQPRVFDFQQMLAKLESVGITEPTSGRPVAHHYKQWVVPAGLGTFHAFEYWENCRPVVIDCLQAGPPAD